MARQNLSDAELERLRRVPEISREALARYLSLTPADEGFLAGCWRGRTDPRRRSPQLPRTGVVTDAPILTQLPAHGKLRPGPACSIVAVLRSTAPRRVANNASARNQRRLGDLKHPTRLPENQRSRQKAYFLALPNKQIGRLDKLFHSNDGAAHMRTVRAPRYNAKQITEVAERYSALSQPGRTVLGTSEPTISKCEVRASSPKLASNPNLEGYERLGLV